MDVVKAHHPQSCLSASSRILAALVLASFLVQVRELLNPAALPPVAIAWSACLAAGYLALVPFVVQRRPWASAASNVLASVTALGGLLNPVDSFLLTHWGDPGASLFSALEALGLPLFILLAAGQSLRRGLDRQRAS